VVAISNWGLTGARRWIGQGAVCPIVIIVLSGVGRAACTSQDRFSLDAEPKELSIGYVAQRNLTPARSLFDDGYREFVADSGEAPIVAGVSNWSPWLEDLFRQGVERYGTNFVSAGSAMASGESNGYRQLDAAVVTTMQAPPLYHTSGEVLKVISAPGLERMARFVAFFIKAVDRATLQQIHP